MRHGEPNPHGLQAWTAAYPLRTMAALAALAIIVIRTKTVALHQGPRAGLTVIVLAQAYQIAVYAAPAIYRHDCYRARDATQSISYTMR